MANTKITADVIEANAVLAVSIADENITSAKLADLAVTEGKIANTAITAGKLATDAVITAKIQNDAVTTVKIPNNAVTSAKLDTNIDIAGTFDVTGAATLDSTVTVAGTGTFTGLVDAAIIDGANFKINGAQGSDGQVLTSTGSGVAWEAIPAGTTINTNADNRVITGSGTADTLNGEANLTFDGSTLALTGTATMDGLTVNGASVFTTADNSAQVTLISTDADASNGPLLDLYRNSASPANSDQLGKIRMQGKNNAGETIDYVTMMSTIFDVADGSEDARFIIYRMNAGVNTSMIDFLTTETVFNQDSIDLNFRVESNNDANALFVQGSDGNVGIGTSSPTHKLEIRNDVAATTDLDPTAIKLYNNSDGGSAVEFSNSVGGKSKISFGVDSTGAGTDDSYLGFSTALNASSLIERLRIASDGSLSTPTLGLNNVRFGVNAGNSIASGGNYNTVVGDEAGTAITTGDNNVAVGYAALASNQTANYLTAVGYGASRYITSGDDAVSLGYLSLGGVSNTVAEGNTALGYACLAALTTGTDGNIGIGRQAGNSHTTATQSIWIGKSAGWGANSSQSLGIGRRAGQGVSTGAGNTAVGFQTMYQSVGTGANNTMIGAYCGQVFTGSNNFGLGYQANYAGSPGGQQAGDNEGFLGDENIVKINAQVDITAASDKRDKTDVEPLALGLSFINQLEPVTYRWDKRTKYIKKYQLTLEPDDPDFIDLDNVVHDGTHTEPQLCAGLLAQDVEEIEQLFGFDKADKTALLTEISGDGKAYSLNYARFVPMLIKSVQELSTEVESLKDKIKELENE